MLRLGFASLLAMLITLSVVALAVRGNEQNHIGDRDAFAIDTLRGEVLLDQRIPHLSLRGVGREKGSTTTPGAFTRLRVSAAARQPYDVQAVLASLRGVEAGQILLLHLEVRTRPESAESATITLAAEAPTPGTPKSMIVETAVPTAWTRISIPFRIRSTGRGGSLRMVMNAGHRAQEIDVSWIKVLRYSGDVFPEDVAGSFQPIAGADTTWRQDARRRIDQHRKANLTVNVVDKEGLPVDGASVKIEMRRHAFRFGTAVNEAAFSGNKIDEADQVRYKKELFRLFNSAVLESNMKWKNWLIPRRRRIADSIVTSLINAGLTVRGHTLLWPSWERSPAQLARYKTDRTSLQKIILSHVREQVDWFRGRVVEWDVVNEPYTNNDIIRLIGIDGVADWFKTAATADSSVGLFVNDFYILETGNAVWTNRSKELRNFVRELRANGAPVTGVGLQSHFDLPKLSAPSTILQVLDSLAAASLDLVISEYDIDLEDETVAADYTRDFLIASFSHPSVKGFYIWGFWDRSHWKNNALLFREDWSLKPAGAVWEELIFGDWWTRDLGVTDKSGTTIFRGFFGEYDIAVTVANSTANATGSLGPGGTSMTIILR